MNAARPLHRNDSVELGDLPPLYVDAAGNAMQAVLAPRLIGSFAVFVLARVSLAADVYFIPVNYPASEATALHISIVGAVCYLVGIVALIVEGFSAKNG